MYKKTIWVPRKWMIDRESVRVCGGGGGGEGRPVRKKWVTWSEESFRTMREKEFTRKRREKRNLDDDESEIFEPRTGAYSCQVLFYGWINISDNKADTFWNPPLFFFFFLTHLCMCFLMAVGVISYNWWFYLAIYGLTKGSCNSYCFRREMFTAAVINLCKILAKKEIKSTCCCTEIILENIPIIHKTLRTKNSSFRAIPSRCTGQFQTVIYRCN